MSSSDHLTISEVQSIASDDNDIEAKLVNNKQFLLDNGLYIPDRYYVRMVQTGLIDQFIKLINDVNQERKLLKFLELKQEVEDEDFREQNENLKTTRQNSSSNPLEPVFYDPELDDEMRPGTTYFTKSFYGSD